MKMLKIQHSFPHDDCTFVRLVNKTRKDQQAIVSEIFVRMTFFSPTRFEKKQDTL